MEEEKSIGSAIPEQTVTHVSRFDRTQKYHHPDQKYHQRICDSSRQQVHS